MKILHDPPPGEEPLCRQEENAVERHRQLPGQAIFNPKPRFQL